MAEEIWLDKVKLLGVVMRKKSEVRVLRDQERGGLQLKKLHFLIFPNQKLDNCGGMLCISKNYKTH